jgi:hypothetical protein
VKIETGALLASGMSYLGRIPQDKDYYKRHKPKNQIDALAYGVHSGRYKLSILLQQIKNREDLLPWARYINEL